MQSWFCYEEDFIFNYFVRYLYLYLYTPTNEEINLLIASVWSLLSAKQSDYITGVSHVSCEPDVVHILDRSSSSFSSSSSSSQSSSSSLVTTTTTVVDNRALTIQTFKLGPEPSQPTPSSVRPKIKLEPGLLQTLPSTESALATPLKVEIQDNYLDSDIEGALIIADSEEMSLANMTLDYFINENGTCTCKLCGEVTASRTHWYRHKYKVSVSGSGSTKQIFGKIKYFPGSQRLFVQMRKMRGFLQE